MSDEDEENADRPTTIDFPQEWQAQQKKGLNKPKLTAKDIKLIEQSEMEREEDPERSTQGTSGVQLSKDLRVELDRRDAKP